MVPKKGDLVFKSFWIYFLPHVLKQDTIEFAVPIEKTCDFFEELQELINKKTFYVQTPIEIRFVKADNFWLSPAYKKKCLLCWNKNSFPTLSSSSKL